MYPEIARRLAEIGRLRLALEDSRGLQQRYDLISAQVDILRSREAMAVEEADRLGAQNAELIGHGNGIQKISYVEGLRREMALVKHVSFYYHFHIFSLDCMIFFLLIRKIPKYRTSTDDSRN